MFWNYAIYFFNDTYSISSFFGNIIYCVIKNFVRQQLENSKPQVIKYISTVSPNIDRTIFAEALVIESINLGRETIGDTQKNYLNKKTTIASMGSKI